MSAGPALWRQVKRRNIRGTQIIEETTLPVAALGQLWSQPMTLNALADECGLDRHTTAARIAEGVLPVRSCGSMFQCQLDALIGWRLTPGPKL